MKHRSKRGLQTALVTGGLLMLGTGIASADHIADLDAEPSPLYDTESLMPAAGLPGLDLVRGLPLDAMQDTAMIPAIDDTQTIPAVPALRPTQRDMPTTEIPRVPGVSDGVQAFQQNLQMPTDRLPDTGSLSGQLPLG